ncbi:MAG: hypothetical protein ABMA64_08040 [Myxococcota bacterium]
MLPLYAFSTLEFLATAMAHLLLAVAWATGFWMVAALSCRRCTLLGPAALAALSNVLSALVFGALFLTPNHWWPDGAPQGWSVGSLLSTFPLGLAGGTYGLVRVLARPRPERPLQGSAR